MSKLVLDISKYDPVNNYKSVANAVDGVLVRVGYRAYRNGVLTEDPLFKKHITNLLANGVKTGVYFFSTAVNANEGAQEAEYVYNKIKDYNISFPVFVDTEYSNANHNGRSDKISKTARTNAIVGFCERIKELGYVPGIYMGDFWPGEGAIDLSKVSKYKLWVARYGKKPSKVTNYIAWQYTETGSVPGINVKVDLSYWYEDIITYNNKSTNESTTVKPSTQISNDNEYTEPSGLVRKGNRGDSVKWIQSQLNKFGYSIDVDGIFGNGTYKAVRDFQDKNNLEVDGIVGKETVKVLKSKSTPTNSGNSATKETSNINNLTKGSTIILNSANLYASSKDTKVVRKISGTYYVWSPSIINNKIRITNKKNSTDIDDVIGWVAEN